MENKVNSNYEVLTDDDTTVYCTMEEGEYFGNMSIMLSEKRTASVRTNDFCETFILESEDFFRIKSEHPEFMQVMKKMSSEKTEKTKQLVLDGIVL